MLFSPFFLRLFAQQRQSRLQPNTLLQFFIFMLHCPLPPIDCSGLLQKHFLHIFWCKHISCQFLLSPSNIKVCQCGHLMPRSRVSHDTAPTGPLTCLHICTSRTCFNQASLCVVIPCSPSRLLLPNSEWPRWKVPPLFQGHLHFHEQRQGGRTLFARCCCHLSPQF